MRGAACRHLTQTQASVIHHDVMRTTMYSIRCAFVALLALSLVTARPAMLLAHAGPTTEHACGMHMSHGAEHPAHHCSGADAGSCCDDCLCACAVSSEFARPAVAVVAHELRTETAPPDRDEPTRARWSPALRLPPPIGPPSFTRS
jgi:hypothetical protein